MAARDSTRFQCENLRHFKEMLKNLRSLDDKIIYKLNVSVPTQSFKNEIDAETKCGTLYKELLGLYKLREEGIKKCIESKSKLIKDIQNKLSDNSQDETLVRTLRLEQNSLRLIQSELMVEEVVKSRSLKVFDERCWKSFTPPSTD